MTDSLHDIILRVPSLPQGMGAIEALLVTLLLLFLMLAVYQLFWRGGSWWRHWRVLRVGDDLRAGSVKTRTAAHQLAAILQASASSRLDTQRPPRVCSEEQRQQWTELVLALNKARFQRVAPSTADVEPLVAAAPWWLYRD